MAAEWDTCEDCMGTGRNPSMFGGGDCGACGGKGRFPANDEASELAREEERRFQARIQSTIERTLDDPTGQDLDYLMEMEDY